MHRMRRPFASTAICISLGLTCLLLAASPAAADDWPQWRGPNRDGKSAETGLLQSWPEDGPPLAWQSTKVGMGYSSPAVADGRVYLMGNGPDREWILCLDEKTGQQLWACATGPIRSNGGGYPGPRGTPTVADGRVYAMGLAGWLVCCDAKTGQPLWWRAMVRDFGGRQPPFGYSESVLVDGDRVICTPGMEKTVVALNAKTGQPIWTANVGDPASYSSPIKATFGDVPQYVVFTLKGLIGVAASDGALLWRYDMPSNGQANFATPVVVGNTVFAASGFGRGGGCAWIRKDDKGAFTAKEMYNTNKLQSQRGGFVVVDNFLYGCGDPGVLVCLNYKTGIVAKAIRNGQFSIAYADDRLYLHFDDGHAELYEASSTNLVSHGSFMPPQRSKSKAWVYPVIANGRLYLRDQNVLLAYNIAADKKPPSAESDKTPSAEGEKKPPAKVGKTPPAEGEKAPPAEGEQGPPQGPTKLPPRQ